MKNFIKLIFLSISFLFSIIAQAQTIDIDQERLTKDGKPTCIASYKAKADGYIFYLEFETYRIMSDDGFPSDTITFTVFIEGYDGKIDLVKKDRNKFELEKVEKGYMFNGRNSDLKPIAGLQLEDHRIMFDEGVHSNIYADVKRLRRQIVNY